ncbi:hypothetical protein L208DRAFT_1396930, partial [Tricholoma matsutake]
MPHNEDVAEHEDTAEHGKNATQALSLSLTHGAESHSAPTTLEHHQMVLSFSSSQPASTLALTFSHLVLTTIPMRKESMSHVVLSWCKCNHPPLVGKKKV